MHLVVPLITFVIKPGLCRYLSGQISTINNISSNHGFLILQRCEDLFIYEVVPHNI
jgi:hypothetical protein